jgi:5-methylcytosine-specific restriction enzyme subunit McrC
MRLEMEDKIPIENIYYMLCYSWGYLKEKDIVNVNSISKKDLPNLFADILSNTLEKLIKMGFDREYISEKDEIATIRGKIDFQESIKKFSLNNAKAICEYDNLSYNILQNQIIKTTIYSLIRSKLIEKEIEEKLVKVYRHFNEIDSINLNSLIFDKVRIHRNNSFYGFIINICELIYQNVIIDETEGKRKFKDFYRDEKVMARVFENFVRNFYRKEQNQYKVKSEIINWKIKVLEGLEENLPNMKTDITLESETSKTIIDTKYYKKAFSNFYDSQTFHSYNMYQINSYLNQTENQNSKKLTGILIYPQVTSKIDFVGELDNYEIRIKTVNLNENWENIHKRLLEIII